MKREIGKTNFFDADLSKDAKMYFDYAATTPVSGKVFSAAKKFFSWQFFNPASTHAAGQVAYSALEAAREKCEAVLNAERNTVYFNSGATEGINQVLKGLKADGQIVVSAIEHDAVLSCCDKLQSLGRKIEYVLPNIGGTITPEAVTEACKKDKTALVCVMTVNNITGAVQPVKELADAAHKFGALFFTDAAQAVNGCRLDVQKTGVDMLCMSAHKFYAFKGSGLLYVKDKNALEPLTDGGNQEYGMRSGTVDVASAVGLAVGLEDAQANVEKYNKHAESVRDALLDGINSWDAIESDNQASDIISLGFPGIDGGKIAVALSMRNVFCSVGSACTAGAATPPKALVAMKSPLAGNSVRFSFGRYGTIEGAKEAASIINDVLYSLKKNAENI